MINIKETILKEKEPYLYDYLISNNNIKINNNIQTFCTDNNGVIYYNENYKNTLTNKELIGVLYHEILHIAYGHIKSSKDNHYLVNIAGDIFINEELKQLNYKLPKGALYKTTYKVPDDKNTAEEIYQWLNKNLNKQQKNKIKLVYGQQEKDKKAVINEKTLNKEQDKKIIKKILSDLESKRFDNHKIKTEDPIKWDIDLTTRIGRLIKRVEEKNYLRPPRREVKGLLMPNYKKSVCAPKINLYIDKSGSMQTDLPIVISSLLKIKNKLKQFIPTYYFFDTEIVMVNESDLTTVCAGGGTMFTELKGDADLHIIITDGELDFNYLDKQQNAIVYLIKNNEITLR